MKKLLTLVSALVALVVVTGPSIGQAARENVKQSSARDAPTGQASGKVMGVNPENNTFTIVDDGKKLTFSGAKLRALPKLNETVEVSYTGTPDGPPEATTVISSKSTQSSFREAGKAAPPTAPAGPAEAMAHQTGKSNAYREAPTTPAGPANATTERAGVVGPSVTASPEAPQTIKICKQTIPPGGTGFAFNWANGFGPLPPFTLNDTQCSIKNVTTQDHFNKFTENVPTGWTLTNISCTYTTSVVQIIGANPNPAFQPGDNTVTIDLNEPDVTCTFINQAPSRRGRPDTRTSVDAVSAAPAKDPCANTACDRGMTCKALGLVGFCFKPVDSQRARRSGGETINPVGRCTSCCTIGGQTTCGTGGGDCSQYASQLAAHPNCSCTNE